MKQIFLKKGEILLDEVPVPQISEHEILVKTHYSCISPGTELAAKTKSGESLLQKAIKNPKAINTVINHLSTNGLESTLGRIKNVMNSPVALGYSASGIVAQIGSKITHVAVGDRVACAGAGIANHAEFIAVPKNLFVTIPEDLDLKAAATMTLGSIALQSVRRAAPTLGEYSVVVGLGILGQILVQLLKASGCKVIGIDLDEQKCDLALSLGLWKTLNASNENLLNDIAQITDHHGVDSVIITAASEKSDIINNAMKMCRKKGKIVIVGDVGLNINREDFYMKELDVLISTSYGPGRYDDSYEQNGIDYPYAYVRWSENRNMEEYLSLISTGAVNINPLITQVFPVNDATKAYDSFKDHSKCPIIALFEYHKEAPLDRKIVISDNKPQKDKLNVGIIGAGTFIKEIHIPNLSKLKNKFNIHAICCKTGGHAKDIAEQTTANYATTDYQEIINDPNIDLVLIGTRHDSHARIAQEAAQKNKAVLLEKPMALNEEEMTGLVKTIEEQKSAFMVGYNRRFSPLMQEIQNLIKDRSTPIMINYRMNAGFIDKNHWTQGPEGGGRNIGEACHIYDLFNFFTNSTVAHINAIAVTPPSDQWQKNDNFTATIKYKDGSVCNLIYSALGTKSISKEQMDLYYNHSIIQMNNYKEMTIAQKGANTKKFKKIEKGHFEELESFYHSISSGDGYPIPLWQLKQASEISFEIEKQLNS